MSGLNHLMKSDVNVCPTVRCRVVVVWQEKQRMPSVLSTAAFHSRWFCLLRGLVRVYSYANECRIFVGGISWPLLLC